MNTNQLINKTSMKILRHINCFFIYYKAIIYSLNNMFLKTLGLIALTTIMFYLLVSTLFTPAYSYSKTTQSQVEETKSTILATPKPDEKVVYFGYCLNVPILMYHHIQPVEKAREKWQTNFTVNSNVFENQMAYLTNSGYTTITLNELANALINKSSLPTKSIALTFDDGYADIYTYAFPILQKYNLKGNLMISTGLINNKDYLTWAQINEMKNSNLISLYNHTWSHYNLATANSEKLASEVLTAQNQLSKYAGVNSRIFAYPYGGTSNKAINFLTENGFNTAVSTQPGQIQCDSFLMTLHRTRVGNSSLATYGI